jgi:hypothetical protein
MPHAVGGANGTTMAGLVVLIAPAHWKGGQNFVTFNPIVAIIIHVVEAVLLAGFCLALPTLYV